MPFHGRQILTNQLFDCPHYQNLTRIAERERNSRGSRSRRVLVVSYAPTAEGYERGHYYAAREAEMASASARDGRFRISTLADFEGDEVPSETVAVDHCTHG